jgi:hypothetical protein
MILNKLKISGLIFFFVSCLCFLNACKDISVPNEIKACNALGDSLNKKAISYSQISKLAVDTVKKNQGCEAYLSALIAFTKINVDNKCFTKSDSINNARLLSTVRCKCTDAFISFDASNKNYNASSTLPKDTLLKNDNCEALAKALKNFLTVGLAYKCLSKVDSTNYTQKLASLRCKCNDAYNSVVATQSAYKKTTSPTDSVKKKCNLYANAITNYIKIGFIYKCMSKTDSSSYTKTLTTLSCK